MKKNTKPTRSITLPSFNWLSDFCQTKGGYALRKGIEIAGVVKGYKV